MKHTIMALTALILLSLTFPASAKKCDEEKGSAYAAAGDLVLAYKFLHTCEEDRNASAEALLQLAKVYGSLEVSNLTEEESLRRAWLLIHRAAALGHLDALTAIVRFHSQGSNELAVEQNEELRNCLLRARAARKVDVESIRSCFGR